MQHLSCTADEFYKKALTAAGHYGFGSLEDAQHEAALDQDDGAYQRGGKQKLTSLKRVERKNDVLCGELADFLKQCAQERLLPCHRPFLFYQMRDQRAAAEDMAFGLHAIGTRDTIAEALVIRAALAVLEDLGARDLCVHLNSIGDRDSSAKYLREVTTILKRHMDDLPQQAREAMKSDVFDALLYLRRKRHSLLELLPRPMEFLTAASRRHLREVLEFLEAAGIPYELDDTLLGHRDYYAQTIFDIRAHGDHDAQEHEPVLACGGRYDELVRRLAKAQMPAVGTVLTLTAERASAKKPAASTPGTRRKPRVYFIHLGFEARLRSLTVIETLRKARIPLYQCLESERLSDQLARAESLAIPYTMIMGHKEAMENSVIVRDTATRTQHTVPVEGLPRFFKEVK